MTAALVEKLGAFIINYVEGLGRFCSFSLRVFFWMWKRPFRMRLLFEQLFFVGNKSLFIVILTGVFTGMVMCYQTYFGFQIVSADAFVAPLVAVSLAKEMAPVFTGLVVAGRAGAAMAANIGSMKVTEQIDALDVMGISATQYLAVPRVVATTLALPLLSGIFQFVGNVGSWVVGTKVLKIDESLYFSNLSKFVFVGHIAEGLIKAYFFGLFISLIGTYFGFAVRGERRAWGGIPIWQWSGGW